MDGAVITVLGIHRSEERNTFVAENYFIRSIVFEYGNVPFLNRGK
ncbi:MAG: hypothetical protein QOK90_01695 [Nitrososphaeraceae archaeon]|nr:hypothetical protein [Nitrososphaeraceae archaeon]